jgi:hypothetical protein
MAKKKPDTASDPAVELDPLPAWEPPEGHIVLSEVKSFTLLIDGIRYEHVSEAPDGRWVYAPR